MLMTLVLAGRILASPLSNLFQKMLTRAGVSPGFVVWMSYAFVALATLPFLFTVSLAELPPVFWWSVVLIGIMDTLGNMFLVKSLQLSDLSIFGPLNAYKPAIALLVSLLLLREIPSVYGVLGTVIIVLGSYLLNSPHRKGPQRRRVSLFRSAAFWYRMLGITLSAISAVLAKQAILHSSPLITLVFWALLGVPVMAGVVVWTEGQGVWRSFGSLRTQWKAYAGLGLSVLAMQAFTQFTFEAYLVGYSLAFFQLSAVINVVLGYLVFKESNIAARLLGALVMIGGAVMILVGG